MKYFEYLYKYNHYELNKLFKIYFYIKKNAPKYIRSVINVFIWELNQFHGGQLSADFVQGAFNLPFARFRRAFHVAGIVAHHGGADAGRIGKLREIEHRKLARKLLYGIALFIGFFSAVCEKAVET